MQVQVNTYKRRNGSEEIGNEELEMVAKCVVHALYNVRFAGKFELCALHSLLALSLLAHVTSVWSLTYLSFKDFRLLMVPISHSG